MGNLCSIFHNRFKNLIKIIPSARKAQLVDYILLGWQTSTYTLKGSNQKWFMKPYTEIVEDTGIPKSTLERYIKELAEEGFIERRQALYSRTKEQGGFEVKKGTYIHVTDKLLTLIYPKPKESNEQPIELSVSTPHQAEKAKVYEATKTPSTGEDALFCSINNNNEGTDSLIMRGSNIRDLYSSCLNNIMLKKMTSSVDKPSLARLTQQFEAIQQFFSTEIKEELPQEVKELVMGTFFNLIFTHRKQFSLPKQVAAEYVFALVNVEFYLPKVTCFKHRNNILSKMIRDNLWKTPKGFYTHFYLGQAFKDQKELREQRLLESHETVRVGSHTDVLAEQDPRLADLEAQMHQQSNLIDALTQSIYQQSTEEAIELIRQQIQDARVCLEDLWRQQSTLEQALTLERCA